MLVGCLADCTYGGNVIIFTPPGLEYRSVFETFHAHRTMWVAGSYHVDIYPFFMLQPIVENAVKHGILPKKEGGTITISGWKEEDCLVLHVKDNGVGMTEYKISDLLNSDEKHEGVGVNSELNLQKMRK